MKEQPCNALFPELFIADAVLHLALRCSVYNDPADVDAIALLSRVYFKLRLEVLNRINPSDNSRVR